MLAVPEHYTVAAVLADAAAVGTPPGEDMLPEEDILGVLDPVVAHFDSDLGAGTVLVPAEADTDILEADRDSEVGMGPVVAEGMGCLRSLGDRLGSIHHIAVVVVEGKARLAGCTCSAGSAGTGLVDLDTVQEQLTFDLRPFHHTAQIAV